MKNYAQQDVPDRVTLFFPYVKGEPTLYFLSSFLEYKKLRLAKPQFAESKDETIFILKSPLKFPKNNLCVAWERDHYCYHAKVPQTGDLIVILPENKISPEALKELQQHETLLFHYQSLPFSPQMDTYIFRKNKILIFS